jgi:hypothetical protein
VPHVGSKSEVESTRSPARASMPQIGGASLSWPGDRTMPRTECGDLSRAGGPSMTAVASVGGGGRVSSGGVVE